jgi:uncharacterized membrane protein YkvA (DUF1232 family)
MLVTSSPALRRSRCGHGVERAGDAAPGLPSALTRHAQAGVDAPAWCAGTWLASSEVVSRVDVIPPESRLTPNGPTSRSDTGSTRFPPGFDAAPPAGTLLDRLLRSLTREIGERGLRRLAGVSGSLKEAMAAVPVRMHRSAEQSRLVIELVDDVRSGRYHPTHWYTLPLAAASLLYAVSPADIVPDALPLAGTLDDIVVLTLALRLLRNELADYCRFKGYPESQFLDSPS